MVSWRWSRASERAAGDGDLGADDVDGRGVGVGLGGGGEVGGAGGGGGVGEGGGFAGAAHGGVEVELGEAGAGVGLDHGVGAEHRLRGGEVLPRVGAEVVAAEDEVGAREGDRGRRWPRRSARKAAGVMPV